LLDARGTDRSRTTRVLAAACRRMVWMVPNRSQRIRRDEKARAVEQITQAVRHSTRVSKSVSSPPGYPGEVGRCEATLALV
jgi:hypothetical protein